MKVKALKITFIIPTYNEEKRIKRCLDSISKQNYPKSNIKIIVVDGGSTDRTIEVVKKYHASVLHNKFQLAEPGVYQGMNSASSDLLCILAADNILPDKEWLIKMLAPFRNPQVMASFTRVINDKNDNNFSKYFNSLGTDPFNEFVYSNSANPLYFKKIYPVLAEDDNYIVYDYSSVPPLIAMAQGFIIRKTVSRHNSSMYDDIEPIKDLISRGLFIAYVSKAGIYHYSFSGFFNFLAKYDHRVINALKHGYIKRATKFPLAYKVRQYIWFVYSLSIIFPIIVAIKLMIIHKTFIFMYHPFACFGLSCVIIRRTFLEKFRW